MSWVYTQNSGRLTDPTGTLQGVGYSGSGIHKNDPDSQNLPNLGPIPCGLWHAKTMVWQTAAHGPYVIVLEPDAATETFGRSGFLMHGDSVVDPGTASEGCVIQSRDVRELFWNSEDHDLLVISGGNQ